jgi:hypothetical protein
LEWVERWYEIEWNDGKGTVRPKENAQDEASTGTN